MRKLELASRVRVSCGSGLFNGVTHSLAGRNLGVCLAGTAVTGATGLFPPSWFGCYALDGCGGGGGRRLDGSAGSVWSNPSVGLKSGSVVTGHVAVIAAVFWPDALVEAADDGTACAVCSRRGVGDAGAQIRVVNSGKSLLIQEKAGHDISMHRGQSGVRACYRHAAG